LVKFIDYIINEEGGVKRVEWREGWKESSKTGIIRERWEERSKERDEKISIEREGWEERDEKRGMRREGWEERDEKRGMRREEC